MSDTKHTPGPWTHGPYRCVTEGKVPDSYAVWPSDAKVGEVATPVALVSPMVKLKPSDVANAKLIAAAPDLLFVLRQILNDLPTGRDWLDPWLEQYARDTVGKAEGRLP